MAAKMNGNCGSQLRASRDGMGMDRAVRCRGPGVGEWEINVGGLRRNYGWDYGYYGEQVPWSAHPIPRLAGAQYLRGVFVFFTLSIAIALAFSGEHGLGQFTNAYYT